SLHPQGGHPIASDRRSSTAPPRVRSSSVACLLDPNLAQQFINHIGVGAGPDRAGSPHQHSSPPKRRSGDTPRPVTMLTPQCAGQTTAAQASVLASRAHSARPNNRWPTTAPPVLLLT